LSKVSYFIFFFLKQGNLLQKKLVSTNIDQLAKSNSQISQNYIPFSTMINSNEYMKKKLTIEPYSICSFHSQNIVFDDITINGCVYVVDCIIDEIGNYHITIIHTDESVIRCHFNSHVFTWNWPIAQTNLMKQLSYFMLYFALDCKHYLILILML
ncbi:hypothetical protein RFI_37127, partial [Reticulomyxa filosa]